MYLTLQRSLVAWPNIVIKIPFTELLYILDASFLPFKFITFLCFCISCFLCKMYFDIDVGDDIFVVCKKTEDENFARRYRELTGATHSFLDSYDGIIESKGLPSKILLMTENLDGVVDAAKQLKASNQKDTNFHVIPGTPPFFVEFLDSNVCKGKGVKDLASLLDMDMSQIMSFGDGDNDLEMIQMSGCGVVMHNAKQRIKDHADVITSLPNTENGVAHMLEKMDLEMKLISAKKSGKLRQLCK